MNPSATALRSPLRALGLAVALAGLLIGAQARADIYSDVYQLMHAGKYQQALDRADRHIAAKPHDVQMRFVKSVIQTQAGQQDEAIATLTTLTQEFPELAEPYNNLAVLYAGRGRLDEAQAALEKAVRNRPDYAVAYENLGDVHVLLARRAYEKALRLDDANTGLGTKLSAIRNVPAGTNGKTVTPVPPVPPAAPATPVGPAGQ